MMTAAKFSSGLLILVFGFNPPLLGAPAVLFVDATAEAGVEMDHQTSQTVTAVENAGDNSVTPLENLPSRVQLESSWLTGGVAAGDYDGDGWPDLFVVGGDLGQSRLFRNNGDGSFSDHTQSSALDTLDGRIAGAVFADFDGDNDLDLFLGGVLAESPRLMRNDMQMGGGRIFVDVFASAAPDYQTAFAPNAWGGAFGDINGDGCLDLFIPHSLLPGGPSPPWRTADGSLQHLWMSGCDGSFEDVSVSSGISEIFDPETFPSNGRVQSFSGIFTDLNRDGRADIVVSGDIGSSLVLLNQGGSQFANVTDRSVIDDKNAMGAAVGDVNNDGEMDWFTSNIGRPQFGNRIYHGLGDGRFLNATSESGVLEGHWGWGACFADFNNDRFLDIFHVNGFYYPFNDNPDAPAGRYDGTPAVLFMSNGDGTYSETAAAAGLADTGEGRGVSCLDYDGDGDLDVAISNHKGPFRLYRNESTALGSFLEVGLEGDAPNTRGIGARVSVDQANADAGTILVREIRAGNNFISANPSTAHFGLGDWQGSVRVRVDWPRGGFSLLEDVAVNTRLTVSQADAFIYVDGFETD